MIKLIALFILAVIHSFTFCQDLQITIVNDSDTMSSSVNFQDYRTYYSSVDLSLWETLKDSGAFNVNGLKSGLWIEYPIDTTIMYAETNIQNDSSKSEIYKPDRIKLIGHYIEGNRNGRWEEYRYLEYISNNLWSIDLTIDYRKGVKHGFEIQYLFSPSDTIHYVIYDNDNPIEFGQYEPSNQLNFIIKLVGEKYIKYEYDSKRKIINETIMK